MIAKICIVVCALVALASSAPEPGWPGAMAWPAAGAWTSAGAIPTAVGTNPWIPPWLATAPWYPQWSKCTTIGTTCLDCTTKLVCTKVGGLTRACTDPTLPFCNAGECSATPSVECTPSSPEPYAV